MKKHEVVNKIICIILIECMVCYSFGNIYATDSARYEDTICAQKENINENAFTIYNYDFTNKTKTEMVKTPSVSGLTTCCLIVEQTKDIETDSGNIIFQWNVADSSKDILTLNMSGSKKEIVRIVGIASGVGTVEVEAVSDQNVIWSGSCQVEVTGTELSKEIFEELYEEGSHFRLPDAREIVDDFEDKNQTHPRIMTTSAKMKDVEKYITMGAVLDSYTTEERKQQAFATEYEKLVYEDFLSQYPDENFPKEYLKYMYETYEITTKQNEQWLNDNREYVYEVNGQSLISMMPDLQQEVEQIGFELLLLHARKENMESYRMRYSSEKIYIDELSNIPSLEKYVMRLKKIMDDILGFKDWNPEHFLDVAQMSYIMGVAYDWIYNDLGKEECLSYAGKIMELGVKEGNRYLLSLDSQERFRSNWCVVDFAGIAVASMAIMGEPLATEEDADTSMQNQLLCAEQIARAARFIPVFLSQMYPDGVEAEGTGYWVLTMRFMGYLCSSMDESFGKDYGLLHVKGLKEALFFPIYITGNSDMDRKNTLTFNYGDSLGASMARNVLVWMCNQYSEIAQLKGESYKEYADVILWFKMNYSKVTIDEYATATVQDMLWMPPVINRYGNSLKNDISDEDFEAIGLSKIKMLGSKEKYTNEEFVKHDLMSDTVTYGRESNNSLFVIRQSFTNQKGVFFATKDYNPKSTHLDMDAGSFIFDVFGTRWLMDWGKTVYTNSRYNYYIKRAEGHNTIVINPSRDAEQNKTVSPVNVSGSARFDQEQIYQTDTATALVYDMSNAYNNTVDSSGKTVRNGNYVGRGYLLFDNNEKLLIQDEINLEEAGDIYSFLQTNVKACDIEISENGQIAVLSQTTEGEENNGKLMLKLRAVCEDTALDIRFAPMAYESLIPEYNEDPINQMFYEEVSEKNKLVIHVSQDSDGNVKKVDKVKLQILIIPFVEDVYEEDICQTTYEQALAYHMPEFVDLSYWQEHPILTGEDFNFEKHPTDINLDKKSLLISERKTQEKLTAVCDGINTAEDMIVWTSSNENIARVDENGIVTPGIANGTCRIMAYYKYNPGIRENCAVTVMIPKRINLSLYNTRFTSTSGKLLKYKVSPSLCANLDVSVISENSDVVKVEKTEDGVWMTPIGNGNSKVIIRSIADEQIYSVCEVEVNIPCYPTKIKLSYPKITITSAAPKQIKWNIYPRNTTNKNLIITSTDSNIAQVSNDGLITPVKNGNCQMILRCVMDPEITAVCDVTVCMPMDVDVSNMPQRMAVGEKVQLVPEVFPIEAPGKGVKYYSSNKSVIYVDANGVLTARSAGSCDITVKCKSNPGVYSVYRVQVYIPVEKIRLLEKNITITNHENYPIQYETWPEKATDKRVTFYSNNKNVAVVDNNGVLTPVGIGKCKIVIRSVSNKEVYTVCNVEVDFTGE